MKKGKCSFSLISLGALAAEAGLIVWCLYQATVSRGSSGLEIGCIGLFSFLIGMVGFHLARVDRALVGRLRRFPLVMMILHGWMLILIAAMYLLGAA